MRRHNQRLRLNAHFAGIFIKITRENVAALYSFAELIYNISGRCQIAISMDGELVVDAYR